MSTICPWMWSTRAKNTRLHPALRDKFPADRHDYLHSAFTLLGWSDSWLIRIGLRLAMLPVVAGVSGDEILKLVAKYDNKFTDGP